jgi:hypothetical protein
MSKSDTERCWFCKGYVTLGVQNSVYYQQASAREIRGMYYKDHPGASVIIPRCMTCAQIHTLQDSVRVGTGSGPVFVGMVAGFGFLMTIGMSWEGSTLLTVLFLILGIIAALASIVLYRKEKSTLNSKKLRLEQLIKSHPTQPYDYFRQYPEYKRVENIGE